MQAAGAEETASLEDLRLGLKQALEASGSLGQIKARIRAEVFQALDDQGAPRAPLSSTNLVINELVREYLEFNRYHYTASVFVPESGQPEAPPFERPFLARQLNVPESEHSARVPLLYTIVAMLERGGPAAAGGLVPAAAAQDAEDEKRDEAAAAAVASGGGDRGEDGRETGVYEERKPIVLTK